MEVCEEEIEVSLSIPEGYDDGHPVSRDAPFRLPLSSCCDPLVLQGLKELVFSSTVESF